MLMLHRKSHINKITSWLLLGVFLLSWFPWPLAEAQAAQVKIVSLENPLTEQIWTAQTGDGYDEPVKGGIGGGYKIVISVEGLADQASTFVRIGGEPANITDFLPENPDSPAEVTVEVPQGEQIGEADVLVINTAQDSIWGVAEDSFEYIQGPTISSITPNYGEAGDEITIHGTGFNLGDVRVKIGGIAIEAPDYAQPVVENNGTKLFPVTIPDGLTGTVSVEVVILDSSDNETAHRVRVPKGFTYSAGLSNPVITEIVPSNIGSTEGGEELIIRGSDFRTSATGINPKVYFGAQLAEIIRVTTDEIQLRTPANTAGQKEVYVENHDGQKSNSVTFTYEIPEKQVVIRSVTPNWGSREGGAPIILKLLNPPSLSNAEKIELTIGGIPAGTYEKGSGGWSTTAGNMEPVISADDSDEEKDAPHNWSSVTPGGIPGDQDVILWITYANGEIEQVIMEKGFTYITPQSSPAITDISPVEGPLGGGTEVTITGSDFVSPTVGEAVYVYFGSELAQNVVVNSSSEITAITPAVSTAGIRDVVVINPDGATAALYSAFTYREANLQIFNITPNYGPVTGGTDVTVFGANFTADTVLEFGYTEVEPIFDGDGNIIGEKEVEHFETASSIVISGDGKKITATTPPNTLGWKDVRVRNQYGSFTLEADASQGIGFRYDPPTYDAPWVEEITPKEGPVTGGTEVAVGGANFATGIKVWLGEIEVPQGDISVESTGDFRFVVPELPQDNIPGWYPLRIENFDGQSWEASPPTVGDAEKPADEDYRNTLGWFKYFSSPEVEKVNPAEGSKLGGGIVRIQGEQLYPGAVVEFGTWMDDGNGGAVYQNVYAEPEEVYLTDNHDFLVRIPAWPHWDESLYGPFPEEGLTVDVSVINNDGGSSTLEESFSYLTPDTQPQVTGIAPDFGPVDGGNQVIISGSNFRPDAEVYFGWEQAEVEQVTSEQIVVTVPPNELGFYPITVINKRDTGVFMTSEPLLYEYRDPLTSPDIAAINPDRGPKEGGTLVTILGEDFWEGAEVYFGAAKVPLSDMEVKDSTTIKVYAPPVEDAMWEGYLGPVDVKVINPFGGTAIKADGFTYLSPSLDYFPQIDTVEPDQGSTGGGTKVTIKGDNFWSGVQIYFDGLPGENLKHLDQQTIVVETPPHDAGTVEMTVVNLDGGVAVKNNAFTYRVPGSAPFIETVDPEKGRVGEETMVTIYGRDFRYTDGEDHFLEVLFGNSTAEIAEEDMVGYDAITVYTPTDLPQGPVDVTVINPDLGSYTLRNGFEFVSSVPKISSLSPAAGGKDGGDAVVLKGEDLDPEVKVYFDNMLLGSIGDDGTAGSVEWVDTNTLKLTTPPGKLGYVDVRVVNPDGEEDVLPNGFLYKSPDSTPAISDVLPDKGPTSGGIWITIRGEDLRERAEVFFAGEPALEVKVLDINTLMALLPPYVSGKVDVTVVNYDGGSATLTDGFEYVVPGSQPEITAVNPDQGPHVGGTEITITGIDFRDEIQVFIDGRQAAEIEFVDYRTVKAITPPGTPGKKDVTVLNPDQGTYTLKGGFTYIEVSEPEIDFVDPDHGETTGGTEISIHGSGFQKGALVYLAEQQAAEIEFIDATLIKAVTPPGELGLKVVKVENTDGGFAEKEAFRYERPRSIPDEPYDLDAWSEDYETIGLEWEKVEFAEYYQIYISESSSGPYRLLDETEDTRYYATGLEPDEKYYFKVRAVNELGASEHSYRAYDYTDDDAPDAESVVLQVQYRMNGERALAVFPSTEGAKRENYLVDFSEQQFQRADEKIVMFSQQALDTNRWLTVKAEGLLIYLPVSSLPNPGFDEQGSAYVEFYLKDLGQREAAGVLSELPSGSRIISPLYQLGVRSVINGDKIEENLFRGRINVTLSHLQDMTPITARENVHLYFYNLLTDNWTSLASGSGFNAGVSADIVSPGWFVLVLEE